MDQSACRAVYGSAVGVIAPWCAMSKPDPVSELIRLIQPYLDRHGVTDAAFARNIGASSQAVSKWRKKPKTFPEKQHLREVARVTEVPYLIVLDAALLAAGYRDSLADDFDSLKIRIARFVRSHPRGITALTEYLESPYFPTDEEIAQLQPDMARADLDALIDEMIAAEVAANYGSDELFDREFLTQYLQSMAPQESAGPEIDDGGIPPLSEHDFNPPPPSDDGVEGAQNG